MAIDYGEKRIGVAITDTERILAFGLDTIEVTKKAPNPLPTLAALLAQYRPDVIVVGLPRNMDGSEGFMVEAVYDFVDDLEAFAVCPIELMDERLTSKMAEASLRRAGKQPSRNKGSIDQEAARLLLEDYLRSLASRRS
jgi:putative holliday junction resolvase